MHEYKSFPLLTTKQLTTMVRIAARSRREVAKIPGLLKHPEWRTRALASFTEIEAALFAELGKRGFGFWQGGAGRQPR